MKIAVYTSIFGNFDNLQRPDKRFKDEADFFLFTNRAIQTNDYRVVNIKPKNPNLRRESRKPKISPHLYFPDYEYTIYIDGSIQMLISPQRAVEKYLNGFDIAVHKHPWRSCIYDEATECRRLGYVSADKVNNHVDILRAEGYPVNNGLTENGVIIRRASPSMRQLSKMWQQEYDKYTQRDQLSFCYCMWELGLKYNLIDNHMREIGGAKSTEFKYYEHL